MNERGSDVSEIEVEMWDEDMNNDDLIGKARLKLYDYYDDEEERKVSDVEGEIAGNFVNRGAISLVDENGEEKATLELEISLETEKEKEEKERKIRENEGEGAESKSTNIAGFTFIVDYYYY
jgi:hypothetical protein